MTSLPAPLTPADCDLREYHSMMLDVRRFRDSDLVAMEEPEVIVAAILLWGAAWHQVPAASLPDDDRVLAQLAGYGKVVKAWKKVRDGALRGFVKCSDGRLYHSTVAAKANEAWNSKLQQRFRTFSATIRKYNERHPNEPIAAPTFEQWVRDGRPEKTSELKTLPASSAGPLFDETDEMSRGHDDNVTRTDAQCHADFGSNRREEKGIEGKSLSQPQPNRVIPNAKPTHARPPSQPASAAECSNQVFDTAQWRPPTPAAMIEAIAVIDGWLAEGFDFEQDILAGIAAARSRKPAKTSSLKRFTSTIRGRHKDRTEAAGTDVGARHIAHETRQLVSRVGQRLSAGG